MILRDTFFSKGATVITCDAKGLKDMKIRTIAVNGNQYDVLRQDISNGISDQLIMYIAINGEHDFRNGDDLQVYY